MDKSNQEQILKIFQSLFCKEQLRKNLYLFQYLNSDMTIRIKTICQQRKVASVSKDPTFVFQCLKKCQFVRVVDQDIICILISGDALIVRIRGHGSKNVSNGELKKMMQPLLKDIKYEIREIQGEDGQNYIDVQLHSETSAAEFIERIKAKNLPIIWQLKQKDPYECIRKSIKYLLKQRKNQQEGNYNSNNSNYSYAHQNYTQSYYNNYQQSSQKSYMPNNYHQYQQNKPNHQAYPVFIRKAVESSQQQQPISHGQQGKQQHSFGKFHTTAKSNQPNKQLKYNQATKFKETKNAAKFNTEDFPTL